MVFRARGDFLACRGFGMIPRALPLGMEFDELGRAYLADRAHEK